MYDLVVIGGGPAGLMAAVTAASNGLKVILVERKRDILEVKRTCAQSFFSQGIELGNRFYSGPVSWKEVGAGYYICFPDIGLEVPYNGPVLPSYQLMYLSPSRYIVKHFADGAGQPWARIVSKKVLLKGLVERLQECDVVLVCGATAVAIDHLATGVKVMLRRVNGEEWVSATAAIIADGLNSNMVEYLGMNRSRQLLGKVVKGVQWVMQGVVPDIPVDETSCFMITIPSLGGTVMVGPYPDPDCQGLFSVVAASATEDLLRGLVSLSSYRTWFRDARVVFRTAYAGWPRSAISNPVTQRALIIGDAAAAFETLISGALACGYQAAKATVKQLVDGSGYDEYVGWWLRSFHFNQPDYFRRVRSSSGIPLVAMCSDSEIDYIYQLLSDYYGSPNELVRGVMEVIRRDKPDLYAKLVSR